ncbi:hypothetical protein GC105_01795 [Alkalibaculum sp. M08DMB]|uniref:Uncharacterized protein n=1 Tax=Alkalibaculum sporogenes TaxID=2655001 RepID=A0A6A7K568_9FIRM|nr:hypothetical protein [Alkalibaculum sporogenes]MPW24525.1 hypothetical protein [Alkalibaculum sporogenes]
MMKLIYYEACKIFHRKIAWVVIIGLILANGLIIHYQINSVNEEGYSIKDIALVYEELEGKNTQEQKTWLEIETERYFQGIQDGDETYSYGMDRVFGLIYEQIEAVSTYDQYLADIDEQAERMMKSSLFATPDTFSYRSLRLTPQAYAHLKGIEVTVEFSNGALLVTDNRLTDAFLLLSLVILAMHLLISEREEGTLPLIKATKRGCASTMLAKAVILMLFTASFTLIFYGTNLIIAANEVGLGDLDRNIQSLEGYLSSPFKITVNQYIGWFFAAKFLGVFAVLCMFFLICIICRNNTYSCLGGIILFGVEALLSMNIDIHSWLSPLSRFNLVALLDTGTYFSNYININLFGYPVNIVTSGILTAIAAMIIGIVVGIDRFVKETSSDVRRNWIREKLEGRTILFRGNHFNLLRHETYKLLIMNKGLLILLVFMAIQFLYFDNMMNFIDQEEFYYQKYSTFLEGNLTEEKSIFLLQEQERFETVEKEQELLSTMYENGEIDENYLTYRLSALEINGFEERAFERAQNQYFQLSTLQQKNIPVAYVYQTGWNQLFDQEGNRLDFIDYGKTFFVLILCLSSYGAIEKMTDMNKIIAVSSKGRKGVTRRKVFICICFAIVSTVTSFLPRIVSVFQIYGVHGLSAPAKSIMEIAWAPNGLSILNFFILYQTMRLIIVGLSSVFIFVISHKTGNTITTMLISAAVLLLPVVTMLLI